MSLGTTQTESKVDSASSEALEQSGEAAAAPKRTTSNPAERLAIYGGPRAATLKYRERWRKTTFRDLVRIGKRIYRDIVTQPGSGGVISEFERKFCRLTGSKYGLAMNSGTATLHSAYFAVGVGPGDEVIVPSYTWFASASPILQLGAKPVFCEVDPTTLTADPDDVQRRITPRTRAICVVHLWGNPARIDRFAEIAKQHNVALIEDASHAHGASYDNRPVGSWGDIGCFSLQGIKAVSGGEAGIAVTDNPVLFDRMLALGHFGRIGDDNVSDAVDVGKFSLGLKYRPHLYAILLALGSLSRLDELNRLRRKNYQIIEDVLQGCPGIQLMRTYPLAQRGGFLSFLLRFDPQYVGGWNQGAIVAAAMAEGVELRPDRLSLLHQHKLFCHPQIAGCGGAVGALAKQLHDADPTADASLPVTEQVFPQLVMLPAFTKVSEEFVRQQAVALRKVAEAAAQIADLRTGS
ncbi:MAG: DegT/DnrJ/EryC1/StrS family aminotransferase [Planctomycetales bacterium]|nr:DegT/DnrJ/EryC1/StrS family aminotransferase [Planctomycetales bacterium]